MLFSKSIMGVALSTSLLISPMVQTNSHEAVDNTNEQIMEVQDLSLIQLSVHNREPIKLIEPKVEQTSKVRQQQVETPKVNIKKQEEAEKKTINVKATAYTAYCKGCSGITAIGLDLRSNPNQKVIAVDPSVIPLGTRVYVEGYGEAIAGDTGGAIKGNRIDVFIPSKDKALEFGVKNLKVTILE